MSAATAPSTSSRALAATTRSPATAAPRSSYYNATAGVNVDLATGIADGDASVGTDTITGGVNNVCGSNFSDTITGKRRRRHLSGNGGNDTLMAAPATTS